MTVKIEDKHSPCLAHGFFPTELKQVNSYSSSLDREVFQI